MAHRIDIINEGRVHGDLRDLSALIVAIDNNQEINTDHVTMNFINSVILSLVETSETLDEDVDKIKLEDAQIEKLYKENIKSIDKNEPKEPKLEKKKKSKAKIQDENL